MSKDNKDDTLSQGEILASIRKMVENEKNASVLDLTDLVDDDGKITKLEKKEPSSKKQSRKETDVGDFLRLIKDNKPIRDSGENDDSVYIEEQENMTDDNDLVERERGQSHNDYIHRIVHKTVKEYLDANLPAIAKRIIEHEVVNMLRKM